MTAPEAGSPLADDLEAGLAEACAGDVVPADVIGEDLRRRAASGHETLPIDEDGEPA